ncbi:MAG: DUF177 domain-containing protein [Candidatus Thiodiazotropha sp. (ex Dulcina madagascariensis)]|nr:DUF177 domain-containing protein [Candidatus Thiodiazotropha sp. (ex Dulcina madagascariensis)]
MSKRFPDRLDPWRFADLGKEFGGELSLDVFPRLSACLLRPAGRVSFELIFGHDRDRDGQRRAVLNGWIRADLPLQCQRCLEEVVYPVDARLSVAFVRGPEEAEQLEESLDPCLVDGDQVVFRDLIEDELLLALPQVAMHDSGVCSASLEPAADEATIEDSEQRRDNPFAVLTELKRGKH